MSYPLLGALVLLAFSGCVPFHTQASVSWGEGLQLKETVNLHTAEPEKEPSEEPETIVVN